MKEIQKMDLDKGILNMLTIYKLFDPQQVEINDIFNDDKTLIIGFEIIIDNIPLMTYHFKNSCLQYGIMAHSVSQKNILRIKNEILEIYLQSMRNR